MTMTDQLQARIDWINTELLRLQGVAAQAETAQSWATPGGDSVQMPTLSAVYKRIETLENELNAKQTEINRIGSAGRVQTRPVYTVRIR